MYKMLFDFVVPAPLIGSLVGLPVQFAGGEGNPDGTPSFDGPHATGYFAPLDNTLPPGIPAPGAAALAAAGAIAALRRRR
jgi:MYXO-CTERM domain-containing protein